MAKVMFIHFPKSVKALDKALANKEYTALNGVWNGKKFVAPNTIDWSWTTKLLEPENDPKNWEVQNV